MDNISPENTAPQNAKPKTILWWFLGILLFLVFVFYLVLLFTLLQGNVSNPIFSAFGLRPENLKSILQNTTLLVFGLGALGVLISALIKFFQSFNASEPIKKKRGILGGVIRIFVFILLIGLMAFFYWLINRGNSFISADPEDIGYINISPSELSYSAPVTLSFSLSTNLYAIIPKENIVQVAWDFENDGIIDGGDYNATHRFLKKPNRGIYTTVAKIYHNTKGIDNPLVTRREVVIKNEKVQAFFAAMPEEGVRPLEVVFDAQDSTDPDGQIYLYEWDLNNDKTYEIRRNTPKFEYTFQNRGEYQVNLRVTGTNNDTDVFSRNIAVREHDDNLKAKITTNNTLEGAPPLKILFSGNQSFSREGDIVKYEWTFEGQEGVAVGKTVEKIFREPGEHSVTLTVTNDIGQRSQDDVLIVVENKFDNPKAIIKTNPKPDPRYGISGSVPFKIIFDASASEVNDPVEWQWDFDGDEIEDAYEERTEYVYRKEGQYLAKLTVVDARDSIFTTTIPISVSHAKPTAKIQASVVSGEAPLEVTFDGSGSISGQGEIVDYIWEFEEKEPIHSTAQVTYLFEKVGTFPVKLTVLNSHGNTAETLFYVSVRQADVKAHFSATPISGSAPLTVAYNPAKSTGTIQKYVWNFGDGTTSQEFAPKHTFVNPGEYETTLRVMGRGGIISKISRTITVTE